MKKLSAIAFCVLLTKVSLFAIPLPEGTDARITEVKQEGGKITYARLKEPTTINTPVGAIEVRGDVYFNTYGSVIRCKPNKNGSYTSPAGILNYRGDYDIEFYDSGCIKKVYADSNTELKTSAGTLSASRGYILFRDNWIPGSFDLGKEQTLNFTAGTITARSGTTIAFYEDGSLAEFFVGKTQALQTSIGKVYPLNTSKIRLHQNGQLQSIVPEYICMVPHANTMLFTVAEQSLLFAEDGRIARITCNAKEITVGTSVIECNFGTYYIYFYADNDMCILYARDGYYGSDSATIDGIQINDLKGIYFGRNDTILCYWTNEYSDRDSTFATYVSNASGKIPLKLKVLNFPVYTYETGNLYYDLFLNKPLSFDRAGNINGFMVRNKEFDKVKDEYFYRYEFLSLD